MQVWIVKINCGTLENILVQHIFLKLQGLSILHGTIKSVGCIKATQLNHRKFKLKCSWLLPNWNIIFNHRLIQYPISPIFILVCFVSSLVGKKRSQQQSIYENEKLNSEDFLLGKGYSIYYFRIDPIITAC